MNAYELEMKAITLLTPQDYLDWVSLAKPMLRQLADRNAELEKDLHMVQRHYDQLEQQLKDAVEIGIAEGFNRAHKGSDEPVAWLEVEDLKGMTNYSVWREPVSKNSIPLYTRPSKQLSDEDIMEYVDAFSQQEGSHYVFNADNVLQMIKEMNNV